MAAKPSRAPRARKTGAPKAEVQVVPDGFYRDMVWNLRNGVVAVTLNVRMPDSLRPARRRAQPSLLNADAWPLTASTGDAATAPGTSVGVETTGLSLRPSGPN